MAIAAPGAIQRRLNQQRQTARPARPVVPAAPAAPAPAQPQQARRVLRGGAGGRREEIAVGPDGISASPSGRAAITNIMGGVFGNHRMLNGSRSASPFGYDPPAAPGGGSGPLVFDNTAEADPDLEAGRKRLRDRMAFLESTATESNSVDTARLKNQSRISNANARAGRAAGAAITASRLGRGPEGAAASIRSIDDQTQRLDAGNDARIELEQQRAQDERNDRRRSELNEMSRFEYGTSMDPARLAMDRQRINLSQVGMQADWEDRRAGRDSEREERDWQRSLLLERLAREDAERARTTTPTRPRRAGSWLGRA
jgi:hypothetical protein